MYDPFQVKVMHCTLGISNQWKWPINREIWYEKVAWKIAPPKPVLRGRLMSLDHSNLMRIFNFLDKI